MSTTKFDPSFKSKRYRDKIRTAVKELEALLPVDRSSVHRKLDSQTVFRLTIAHFRTKLFLEAAGLSHYNICNSSPAGCPNNGYPCHCMTSPEHMTSLKEAAAYAGNSPAMLINSGEIHEEAYQQRLAYQQQSPTTAKDTQNEGTTDDGHQSIEALGGFVLIVTSDGTILYVSNNILQHLGFNQVDLMLRCIYGIVHPDDHQELKIVLENSLADQTSYNTNQRTCCVQNGCVDGAASCRMVSFLCRIKCFNGTTAGYLKMHCMGHMRSFPHVTKSQRTSNQVLFAFCRPFVSISTDHVTADNNTNRNNSFWTKHELDMKIKQADEKLDQILGYNKDQLVNKSFYSLVHPEDLPVVSACHKALLQNEEVQTIYFRLEHQDGRWIWLHTRCKILAKNSRKYAISCAHCVVREEDSTYIQQEAASRQRYYFNELATGQYTLQHDLMTSSNNVYSQVTSCLGLRDEQATVTTVSLHDPHGYCPSSWHAATDRHSPVFPISQLSASNSSSSNQYKQYPCQYPYITTELSPFDASRVPADCSSWYPAFSAVTSADTRRLYVNTGTASEQVCYPAATERLKSIVSNRDRDRTAMFPRTQFYEETYQHKDKLHSSYVDHSRLMAGPSYSGICAGADTAPASAIAPQVKNNNYYMSPSNCYYSNQQFTEQSATISYSQLVANYHDNYYFQLPVNAMTVNDS